MEPDQDHGPVVLSVTLKPSVHIETAPSSAVVITCAPRPA